jgi:ParB family chromosome partitioning protein
MKSALGRGLGALIPEVKEGVHEIEIQKIKPNPEQPRKIFNKEGLKELSASIREKGILQPVIVRRGKNDFYYLIAGERRWRAASLAGLKKIPALTRESTPAEALEIALVENIQRDDLNPIEMAEAFQRLTAEYQHTQESLSRRIGKDRATVANYIRLLKLPYEVKDLVNNESLSMGHARAILSLSTKMSQLNAARVVVKKGLNVRETEFLCKRLSEPSSSKGNKQRVKDPNIVALEERLRQSLGTKVRIKHRGKRGKIEIEYYSLDELDRLLDILTD